MRPQKSGATEKPDWPKIAKDGNAVVKVYRRRRCDGKHSFEVADYSTGARRLLSFADEVKAMAKAKKIAELLAAGETAVAQMRTSDVQMHARVVEVLRPYNIGLETCVAHFVEAVKILGGNKVVAAATYYRQHNADKLQQRTVAQVVDELLANKEKRQGNTVDDLRARCRKFATDFKLPIGSVTTSDVQRWLDRLQVSERTRFNYRTKIGQLFRFAERRGYIPKNCNPVDGTERPDVGNGGPITIYTPSELHRLLYAANPEFAACIALGAFAGLRSSEIQCLDWSKVDFARGHIEVTGKKRGTPARRIVPVTDNLRRWLAPVAQRAGLVWEPATMNRQTAEDHFSDAQAATSAATADTDKNLPAVVWRHNALRHSFISYRLAELQNVNQAALEAGNSAGTIFKHYRELVSKSDAVKWFGIVPEQQAAANIIKL